MINVIGKIRNTLEIWNGYGANLKYSLSGKNGCIYLENVFICKSSDVVNVSEHCDAVYIDLKDMKRVVVVVQWIDGNDAFICQMYRENINNENDHCMLYDLDENNRNTSGIIDMENPRIINKLDDGRHQIQDLVYNVLRKACIEYETCIIHDFDIDKVYITIDDQDFTIRTWNVCKADNDFQYRIDYTLFINLWNEEKNYGYGEEIDFGTWHVYHTYQ